MIRRRWRRTTTRQYTDVEEVMPELKFYLEFYRNDASVQSRGAAQREHLGR